MTTISPRSARADPGMMATTLRVGVPPSVVWSTAGASAGIVKSWNETRSPARARPSRMYARALKPGSPDATPFLTVGGEEPHVGQDSPRRGRQRVLRNAAQGGCEQEQCDHGAYS